LRDKLKTKEQKLNRIMQHQPEDSRNISQAKMNADNATHKVEIQDRILTETIDKLEQRKLNDMKVD
jgi:hypothetical protein